MQPPRFARRLLPDNLACWRNNAFAWATVVAHASRRFGLQSIGATALFGRRSLAKVTSLTGLMSVVMLTRLIAW